jgi:hypothetical protein
MLSRLFLMIRTRFLTLLSGATVTFQNLPAGSLLPVRATRIFATRTTATGILGLN